MMDCARVAGLALGVGAHPLRARGSGLFELRCGCRETVVRKLGKDMPGSLDRVLLDFLENA
jgi:hypothetical protein